MVIRKLSPETLTAEQFRQMVHLELHCGLEPYSPTMLHVCITTMDTYGAFLGEELAGFVTLHRGGRYIPGGVYVVNLNVGQPFRGQGMAKRLLYAAGRALSAHREEDWISLDVSRANRAMELYEKLGFQVLPIPSANGPTDVVMAMPLEKLLRSLEEQGWGRSW